MKYIRTSIVIALFCFSLCSIPSSATTDNTCFHRMERIFVALPAPVQPLSFYNQEHSTTGGWRYEDWNILTYPAFLVDVVWPQEVHYIHLASFDLQTILRNDRFTGSHWKKYDGWFSAKAVSTNKSEQHWFDLQGKISGYEETYSSFPHQNRKDSVRYNANGTIDRCYMLRYNSDLSLWETVSYEQYHYSNDVALDSVYSHAYDKSNNSWYIESKTYLYSHVQGYPDSMTSIVYDTLHKMWSNQYFFIFTYSHSPIDTVSWLCKQWNSELLQWENYCYVIFEKNQYGMITRSKTGTWSSTQGTWVNESEKMVTYNMYQQVTSSVSKTIRTANSYYFKDTLLYTSQGSVKQITSSTRIGSTGLFQNAYKYLYDYSSSGDIDAYTTFKYNKITKNWNNYRKSSFEYSSDRKPVRKRDYEFDTANNLWICTDNCDVTFYYPEVLQQK